MYPGHPYPHHAPLPSLDSGWVTCQVAWHARRSCTLLLGCGKVERQILGGQAFPQSSRGDQECILWELPLSKAAVSGSKDI